MTTATSSPDFEKLLDEIVSKFIGHAPIRTDIRNARPRTRSTITKRSRRSTFQNELSPTVRKS